ncbi:hypothetical protein CEXT_707921 [Caerostris extrusa]|uniref:Uncharacterized protein n=1 Tax=Caerostris extrusa TaxID=172846 RepID=A0AAV4TTY0_CAEEX|nr:hypothetical protein CEXT_707921 [Caerostris extrusa]
MGLTSGISSSFPKDDNLSCCPPPGIRQRKKEKNAKRQRAGSAGHKRRVSSFPKKNFPLLSYRLNLTRRFSLSNLLIGSFSKNRSPFE